MEFNDFFIVFTNIFRNWHRSNLIPFLCLLTLYLGGGKETRKDGELSKEREYEGEESDNLFNFFVEGMENWKD